MIATVLSFRGYAAWSGRERRTGDRARPGRPGRRQGSRSASGPMPRRWRRAATRWQATHRRPNGRSGQAIELAGQLTSRPGENRPWSYWYSPAFFQCQKGVVLSHFAHIPRFRDQAAAALCEGYATLPDDEKLSDWAGGYLAALAVVYEHAGDVDQACAVTLDAACIARRTGSVRLLGMLRRVGAGLAARWPDDPRVAELADALR